MNKQTASVSVLIAALLSGSCDGTVRLWGVS